MKRIAFLMILMLIAGLVTASNPVGKLVAFEGRVKIYHENDVRGEKVKENYIDVFAKDIIKTKSNSTASIRLADDSKIVVTEKSTLEIPDLNNVKVAEGKVLFKITKQTDVQGLKIATKTATIGVKGTTFAVLADNNTVNIFLKEGKLKIDPIQGEFKRFVEKEKDDFSEFMKQQQSDFNEYKKKVKDEFYEYVKSVTMEAGTAISISGNEVRNIKLDDKLEREFRLLDQF